MSKNNFLFIPDERIAKIKGRLSKSDEFWIEGSFEFSSSQGNQVSSNYTKRHIGTSFGNSSSRLLLSAFFFILFLLLLRTFSLQFVHGSYYSARSENNRVRNIPIVAERGTILDRYGIPLTKNIPNFALAITPQDLPRDKQERMNIVSQLASITDQDPNSIQEQLEKYGNYSYESIVLLDDLEYEQAISIQIQAAALPGIKIQRGSKRLYVYPDADTGNGDSFSHILGYNGKLTPEELDSLYRSGYLPSDSIGKVGIEKEYESVLRGVYGRKQIEVNSQGKEQIVIAQKEPENGEHIYLSIDAEAQIELERVVKQYLAKANLTNAAAVALNPQNGEVLAMVSLPAYNNNDFSGGISSEKYKSYIENPNRPLFNRVISGTYPSGSTIKLVMAIAGLQEGIITPATKILSNGGVRIAQWFFPDWQAGGHGITDVKSSIANSVNTFYYYVGGGYGEFQGLGVEKIAAYFKKFGFGKPTGIDIPGEQGGFIPSKESKYEKTGETWYIGDTYNLSIGQGDLLVTPLQIANMTATVANGGTIYEPHLVQATSDSEGNKVYTEPVAKATKIADREYISVVKAGMKDCVTLGSCRRLSLLPFSSGGKTGTAQWSSKAEPHAWFTSFAPYENSKIVVTVLVEEGEGGSLISAPIAYEFLRWWGEHRM